MDKNLARYLDSYFNDTLKKSLGYGDSFIPPIYKDNMIFFKNIDAIYQLGNILRANVDLTSQLKSVLLTLLRNSYKDLDYIKLSFNDQGFGIILGRREGINLGENNIDTYMNIISKLDSVEQIDEFCRSSRQINQICRSKELWRKLIKSVYNFPYKYEYNYKKLYKGYIIYKSYVVKGLSDIQVLSFSHIDSIWNFIKFLQNEGLINPEDYKYYINYTIWMGDKEFFDLIINYYSLKNVNEFEMTNLVYNLNLISVFPSIFETRYNKLLSNLIYFTKGLIYKGVNIENMIIAGIFNRLTILIENHSGTIESLKHNDEFKRLIKDNILDGILKPVTDPDMFVLINKIKMKLNIE